MDQNVALYRTAIRSKKWWWPFFTGFLDYAVQNAWLIYRMSDANRNMKLDHMAFQGEIVRTYLQRYSKERSSASLSSRMRPAHNINLRVSLSLRFDGAGHIQEGLSTQRRCIFCKKAAKNACSKCQVPLHNKCAAAFHTKP